jgi:hypothetical protein
MYTVDRSHLPALRAGADVLVEHGRRVGQDYGWSGYCMFYTLAYLGDQGVTFDSVGEYLLLESADRVSVDPVRHNMAEIAACLMEELDDGEDDEETQGWASQAGVESLQLLHDQLERLAGDDVLLLRIS